MRASQLKERQGESAYLVQALQEQIAGVDARVRCTPAYGHESNEVRVATRQVPVLMQRLGLRGYVDSLNLRTGKPQVLLGFECALSRPSAGPLVLKIYGRRHPVEAALQGHWRSRGVLTPEVLASGEDPVSWLLLKRLSPIKQQQSDIDLTRQVAQVMRQVHGAGAPVALRGARELRSAIGSHLHVAIQALRRHGHSLSSDWVSQANETLGMGQRLILHGDLCLDNILQTSSGPALIDSCGYVGDLTFDAARWVVRLAVSTHQSQELLHNWLQVEPELDSGLARRMLATESLMQAGIQRLRMEEQRRSRDHDQTLRLLRNCQDVWGPG